MKQPKKIFLPPLKGLDIEAGPQIFKGFRLLLSGYHFRAQNVPNITGAKVRFVYDIFENDRTKFSLQAESPYDKVRRNINFAGFQLSFSFGGSNNNNQKSKLTSLEKLMTRDLVRDVDIQTEKSKRYVVGVQEIKNKTIKPVVYTSNTPLKMVGLETERFLPLIMHLKIILSHYLYPKGLILEL